MGSEKFGIKSFMRIAMLEDVDLVLSDTGMPGAYRVHFSNIGVTSAVSRDEVAAYLDKIE
jgi:DeoR/GlpR family transcriptional regulator of sugar metabolism